MPLNLSPDRFGNNLALLSTSFILYGQGGPSKAKGSGGGGGGGTSTSSPPSASSGAANSGGQQVGYVYRLHHLYHMRYGTKNSTTRTIARPAAAPANETWAISATDARVITCDTVNKGVEEPQRQTRVPDPCPNNVENRTDVRRDTIRTCGAPCGPPSPFTLTEVHIDSLSRFWDKPRKLFSRWRLRVAVTQADSGKVQMAMYDNNFPVHVGHYGNSEIDYTVLVTGSKRVGDHAIPISADDSAQAFYLQIDNKAMAVLSTPFATVLRFSLNFINSLYGVY